MSKLARTYDRSRVPLYLQVASVMRRRVEAGHWQHVQKISTLEELEREFEVARVTVRQAIELLAEEGLLYCQQGRGTFVADEPPKSAWAESRHRLDVADRTNQGPRAENAQGTEPARRARLAAGR